MKNTIERLKRLTEKYATDQPVMPLDLGGVCKIGIPYDPRSGHAVGIDVGGTLVKGLALAEGSVVHIRSIDSSTTNPDHVIDVIASIIDTCKGYLGKAFSLGIGWSGPVSVDGKCIRMGKWDQIPESRFAPLEHLGATVSAHYNIADVFIQKDATLEAYGVRVLKGPISALVLNLGVNRVTGGLIDALGKVRFDLLMELGHIIVAVGKGLPQPLANMPPGALAQFVSQPGWLWAAHEQGLGALAWEQFVERIMAGDPLAVATLNHVARWLLEGCALAVEFGIEPPQQIYLSGGTMASPVGEKLLATVQTLRDNLKAERPGIPPIAMIPTDPMFGGAFGAAHAANHSAQVNRWKRELRGEVKGKFAKFARAIKMARWVQLAPSICRAVMGTEKPRAPLDREGCVALIGRILEADDPQLSGMAVQMIREWLRPHMGEALDNQIAAARRLGQRDLLRKLIAYRELFRSGGVI